MRTRHTARSKSFTSRALLAVVIAVLGTSAGRAPVRAQQAGAPRESAPAGQSVTLLPDGRWLVIGGVQSRSLVQVRGADGTVTTLSASLLTPRAWHTATVLSDGSVLVVGGTDAHGTVLAAPERFVPGTGRFEALPADGFAPRANHTATLLSDGRVLIVGGKAGAVRDDADVWDPAAERADPLGSRLNGARSAHTATLQADGRVRISGGTAATATAQLTDEVFDPGTGEFQVLATDPTEPPALYVTSVSPHDGATKVPLNPVIALRFSQRVDVRTITDGAIAVSGPGGKVVTRAVAAEGGRLAFVRPVADLEPSSKYVVEVRQVATAQAVAITPATFSFTTKDPDGKADEDFGDFWAPGADDWHTHAAASPWQGLPPLSAAPGVTALAGQVLRLDGRPLADVTLEIAGHETRSDRSGRFLLALPGDPGGRRQLEIKGASANRPGRTYGFFEAGLTINAGRTNVLPYTIWMPRLDTAHVVRIASPLAKETVVTTPFIPGLELHLPAGTVIKGEDGQVVREVSITPIPVDRPPFPLPSGFEVPIYFTIQPGGAYISNVNRSGPKGAQLIYPNYRHAPTGVIANFWHYDPDVLDWYVYGWGTVRGTQVFPQPQTRLYAFTGAMINTGNTPPGSGPSPGWNPFADPVDPATGLFVFDKTDLFLPDVMPLAVHRTYRPGDPAGRPFGTGQTHDYAMFLWSAQQYTEVDLILPDGGRVHYVRTSAGTSFGDAVFEHTTSSTPFFKSTVAWNGNGWNLTLKNGTVYVFGDVAPLQAIRDRYGNEIRLTYSATNNLGFGIGNVTRVTSPNGRWIQFTYDSATPVNRVTQATDNIGRTVTYTYDANGNLATVTDPENNQTTYTWDVSNRLVSIKDGRNITWLTNQYDASNRVTQQTLADASATWHLAYTTDGGGNITQTDVTDPRGHIQRLTFNGDHQIVTATQAYGTSLQRTTTITRQAGSNLPTAVVDPLNRRTEFTYDTSGHVLTTTRLAGTADAVTTTFTYEPVFSQLASVTDPLGHSWSTNYDSAGRQTGATDPLSHQSAIAMSATGQMIQATDPLQHSWQFGYTAGDLTSVTDPLGRVRSQFVDAAGRTIASTDPLGRVTRTVFDKLNQVTSATDPLGGVTSFTYDPNGNLLSVSDALSHTTSYTYDASDRVATRTDPLLRTAWLSYDQRDHLSQVMDRKSQVTGFAYDALDRLAQVTYADASTVTYTYDAGDRVTQIADSANGTITHQYDGFDRLTEETTPEGTIDYTYDADGRRASMTVAGQAAVTYEYDSAHRLTSITKGTATALLAYDEANRRTSLTYPNGIVASYTYDNANRLLCISYARGSTTLGDLTYVYDAAGNPVTVGGAWARTGLPPVLASATYDAGNRIATWGGASSTYDLNGNLTGDGTNSYTWNARGQLASVSGGSTASFAYDAVGRRRAKTAGGSTTGFIYDGSSLVQERSGGSPTANLLGGPGIDEILTRTDAGGTQTLLAGALGSTVALTDASGVVQASYTYEPFGQATATGTATSNPVGFTGREADGTGLDFYRARYYDPRRQRFISEDPAGFGGGSTNLFGYVGNRPTVLTDPTGKNPFIILPLVGCAGGALGAGWMSNWNARKMLLGCGAGALIGLGGAELFAAAAEAGVEGAGAEMTAARITELNQSFGGTTTLTGDVETVIANMSYRDTAVEKAATAIRDIAGRHLFADANKRTAQAVAEEVLGSSANPALIRTVVNQVATGALRTVEQIASALLGGG